MLDMMAATIPTAAIAPSEHADRTVRSLAAGWGEGEGRGGGQQARGKGKEKTKTKIFQ